MFLPAGYAASPVTIIPTKLRGSPMGNGDADEIYQLSFLAAAGAATTGNYGDRAFADGQWKCRLEQLWFLLRGQLLVYILCL